MQNKRKTKVLPLRTVPSQSPSFILPSHGALKLPTAQVDSYNLDVIYEGRRLAAYTNKSALKAALEKWRRLGRLSGDDPFGERDSSKVTKKQLDAALGSDDCQARSIVLGAIEEFSHSLALLAERFLHVPEWRDTERIVVGGGLPASDTGKLIIRRTQALLNDRGVDIELAPIRNHPHEAALVGAAHLLPSWMMAEHDVMLAVDIGGTNVRIGAVQIDFRKGRVGPETRVWKRVVWRHADDNAERDDVLRTIAKTIKTLIAKAEKKGMKVAPYIGVACPGSISADGSIGSGSEVLPGNWRSRSFNLPAWLRETIPRIGGRETVVILHNDAVVQGLSAIPSLGRLRRWGVFTVGTGLGNARFSLA